MTFEQFLLVLLVLSLVALFLGFRYQVRLDRDEAEEAARDPSAVRHYDTVVKEGYTTIKPEYGFCPSCGEQLFPSFRADDRGRHRCRKGHVFDGPVVTPTPAIEVDPYPKPSFGEYLDWCEKSELD